MIKTSFLAALWFFLAESWYKLISFLIGATLVVLITAIVLLYFYFVFEYGLLVP